MTLRVAVQMDPIETINIAGDSSFALMEAAQKRGHSVYHYDVKTLALDEGRLTAWAAPVTVQRIEGDHFTAEDRRSIDLTKDVDVVLLLIVRVLIRVPHSGPLVMIIMHNCAGRSFLKLKSLPDTSP